MIRALIIGGGVAGPVTALALRKAGIDSVIYEAYPSGADDIGAFLTIMSNGMDALRAVDAHELVIDSSFPADTVRVFSATGEQLGARPIGGDRAGALGARTLRRSWLYRVLHDEAARRGVQLVHGKRLVGTEVTSDDRVVARFADGTTAEGDILIGADGIHSATRTIIDPHAPAPRYTGLNILYGYTQDGCGADDARDAYHMVYGKHTFFGYTTAPDRCTWWFARIPGSELTNEEIDSVTPEQWKQRALALVTDDNTPCGDIIRATGHEILAGNAYDVPTTPVWHTNSMVLVGDAAHAASPAAGQGASMALEDSVVLAKCLRDLSEPSEAFRSYEKLRRERVESLVAASAEQGRAATQRPRARPSESRDWLHRHHIDWDAPVGTDMPGV